MKVQKKKRVKEYSIFHPWKDIEGWTLKCMISNVPLNRIVRQFHEEVLTDFLYLFINNYFDS